MRVKYKFKASGALIEVIATKLSARHSALEEVPVMAFSSFSRQPSLPFFHAMSINWSSVVAARPTSAAMAGVNGPSFDSVASERISGVAVIESFAGASDSSAVSSKFACSAVTSTFSGVVGACVTSSVAA